MKNKFFINLQKDEIDLFELFKIIWIKKSRIVIITFISSIIGFFYYYQKPTLLEISLKIEASPNIEFNKLLPIYRFIDSQQIEKTKNKLNEKILEKFVDHISIQKNLIKIFQNSEKFKKNFPSLSGTYIEADLYKYTKFLNIEKARGENNKYILKLSWHNREINNGREMLVDVLNETSLHFQQAFFKELLDKLKAKKEYIIATDLDKITFLKEQYQVASKLGILSKDANNSNYQISIDFDNFYIDPYSIKLNPYFLLGQEVILLMINLVENRSNKIINNLENSLKNLKNTNTINWVEYDPFLINVKSENNLRNILLVSIMLGLVIGVLQVLLFNVKLLKKNKQTYF